MGKRSDSEKRSGIKKSAKIVGRKTMDPGLTNSYESSPIVRKVKNNYVDDRFSAS